MQTTFSELVQVSRVLGYALLDASGECLVHGLQPPYEPILLEEVFGKLQTILTLGKSLLDTASDFESFTIRGADHYLLVRAIDARYLLVLTESSVNVAMVNVAIRVAAIKLERGASQRSSRPPHSMTFAASPTYPSAPASFGAAREPDYTSLPTPQSVFDAAPTSSVSVTQPSPTSGTGSSELARAVLELLARRIGPYARVLIKMELRAMAVDPRALSLAHLEDLALRLASKIPGATERGQFLREVSELQGKTAKGTR
jgi:predicted regulator of Ras-like GTPase activity (Roadblock/LC7/MglB family)